MARRIVPFDRKVINKELKALPKEDFLALIAALGAYAVESASGFVVKSYGEGLMMVKDDSRGQGRCLLFSVREVDGVEIVTVLLVYKKESQEAPKRVLDTARRRMRESK